MNDTHKEYLKTLGYTNLFASRKNLSEVMDWINMLPNGEKQAAIIAAGMTINTLLLQLDSNGDLKTQNKESEKQRFIDFLIERIFECNYYGSSAELITALNNASSIEEWRDCKAAFNEVSDNAPMNEVTNYLARYDEVAELIQEESEAWVLFNHPRTQNGE